MSTKKSDLCKFCDERVNLDGEGVTYKDGSCAHEDCHDAEEFRRENAVDMEDRDFESE
jgi:hypothetical protein